MTPHDQVVAAAVVSMSAEVTAARARLEDLIQRREEIERELEAGAGEAAQLGAEEGGEVGVRGGGRPPCVTRQSSLPAKLHHPATPATWHGHSEDNLELDTQDTGPDTARDREGWLFSPRSATPTSDYQETAGEEQMEPPDPAAIARHRKQYPKVVINIGGVKHEVMWRMLEKRPLTRLGMLAKARTHEDILKLVDAYSLTDNEIYFDRDPLTFNSILNFYRTDHLHVIDELCVLDFAEDLEFWMIKEINLEICCVDKFNTRRDHILAEVQS